MVGAVVFNDPDPGDTFTFVLEGNVFDSVVYFEIDTDGIIVFNPNSLNITLDFETKTGYEMTVTITDALGVSDTAMVNVLVNDINEIPVYVSE